MKDKEQKDIDFEIQFCEGLLKKNGNFCEALGVLGDLYTKKGLYKEGLEIDLKLARLKPEDPIVLYNLACSHSLLQETDKAYGAIKSAMQCGYNDFLFLEEDDDLANLRADGKFKSFFAEIRKEAF